MAFTLRILIEGLCVFFPETSVKSVEVVFLSTADQAPANAHTCQLSLRRGTFVSSGVQLPMTLTEHDLDIFDGPYPIPAPPHSSPASGVHSLLMTPKLGHVLGSPIRPKRGVRRHTGYYRRVAARIQLPEGQLNELYVTKEEYEIFETKSGAAVGKSQTRLFQCLLYEREIESDTVTIRATDQSGNLSHFEVWPTGNFVEFTVANFSHTETYAKENERTVSPHFGLVFGLFEHNLTDEFGLRLAKPYLPSAPRAVEVDCGDGEHETQIEEIRGLHIPCVGGCTC